jgi:hypothetical protein
MSPYRLITSLVVACFTCAFIARAQDAPKDDALDNLLKKLEERKSDEGSPPKAKDGEDSKDKKTKGEGSKKSADGQGGSVPPKDEALDNLLEKLSESKDAPTPEQGPRQPAPRMPQPKPQDQEKGSGLAGKEKELDEHLEELLGRKRKKPQDEQKQQQNGDDEGSPLSDIIKEMRDVEQRLSKPDTGEQTREKQQQIVKKLDTLIEQMRSSSSQGKIQIRQVRQGSQRPGDQNKQGAQANNQGGGVNAMRPQRPPSKGVAAGGKDEWGHLPPELRAEIMNSFREEELPERAELIRRYYLSLSKKGQSRGD